jgi:alkanesulfonate monooxygenase SsuD/methylene tetrahydromethanopterin reductase-like flavin-dependent oxidoreductase (luciferase family)
LILGVGVGSLREEFALLGAPFDGRGERADDAMRALRASLSQTEPSYHGTHYDFEGFLVEPRAVQRRVPLWVGGRTFRSWRRAVELGDGWAPFGLRMAELAAMLDRLPPPTDRTSRGRTSPRIQPRIPSAAADHPPLLMRSARPA